MIVCSHQGSPQGSPNSSRRVSKVHVGQPQPRKSWSPVRLPTRHTACDSVSDFHLICSTSPEDPQHVYALLIVQDQVRDHPRAAEGDRA